MKVGGSFVLFPLGKKRFALPSERVAELARPDRMHLFPHTSPLLAGVLVRRGHIVPVCDVADVLVGPEAPARRYYLIANRRFGNETEWTAIPVTGECELASGEVGPCKGKQPDYVTAVLALAGGEILDVVDLEKLIDTGMAGTRSASDAKREKHA